MIAELRVVIRDGRLVELSGEPPLSAKLVPGMVLQLVSSAATLLEGDELRISIDLGERCHLTVRSVAAQLAFPCLGGGSTRLSVDVRLGAYARFVWAPEPLVACAGSSHRSDARVSMAAGATLLWRDELILGRSGEDVTSVGLQSVLRVERDSRPVLHDGVSTETDGALGPASIGGARYLGTIVDLGDGRLELDADPPAMILAADAGAMLRILAPDSRARKLLDQRLV